MEERSFREVWQQWLDNLWPWMLSSGIRIVLTILGGLAAYFILRAVFKRVIKIAVRQQPGEDRNAEKQREKTLLTIVLVTMQVVIAVVMILMILMEFSVKITPLLASAGVVGLALGFGGQYLIKDVISGLFIILENQYRIDDYVNIAGLSGKVEAITLRVTTLRDLDGNTHYIPHGTIDKVSNLSKSFSRINLDIGVAYGSDISKVAEIINRVGKELYADPEWSDNMLEAPYFMRVQELGDSAVVVKILGNVRPSQQWAVSGEIRKRVYNAFMNEDIEIPFPQHVVHLRQEEKNN